jgi:hypothetical protein
MYDMPFLCVVQGEKFSIGVRQIDQRINGFNQDAIPDKQISPPPEGCFGVATANTMKGDMAYR